MKKQIIKNEHGFTLLESLFQLVVFVLFASISLLIFIWIRDIHQLEKMNDDVNWEFFVPISFSTGFTSFISSAF